MNSSARRQPQLTLGFSTMAGRMESLIDMLEKLGEVAGVEILVVIQGEDEKLPACLDFVTTVFDSQLGLSHSRNLVIENSHGQYIWFLDDDVVIEQDNLNDLLQLIASESNSQVFRAQIGCLENRGNYYKPYATNKVLKRLQLLQVSSIELIVQRQFIIDHNIRFNEKLGLGTPLPATEEVNFLLDIESVDGSIINLNQILIYHTCHEQGRLLACDGIFKARGATASRFGVLGPLLLLRWGWRYFLRYRQLSYVKSLIRGYYQGYQALL
ncbi:glycosyltransferase family 2 protein [Thalassotalea litorea]|uniref:glycosyltransferase family 2 protein n=1 Tax=Thalassotalea litorea TaxID=2020715 RepID=UPI0014858772|nr:glycosyltransferase family A protein [Thalassotalea litorea]